MKMEKNVYIKYWHEIEKRIWINHRKNIHVLFHIIEEKLKVCKYFFLSTVSQKTIYNVNFKKGKATLLPKSDEEE